MGDLASQPFTSVDSARVDVGAPANTQLLTDLGVNDNNLLDLIQSVGRKMDVITAEGLSDWIVPDGVTNIICEMRGAGGGGGAGGNGMNVGVSAGTGQDGGDTWVGVNTNLARGGSGGGAGGNSAGWHLSGTGGSPGAAKAPVIASTLIQYGSRSTESGGTEHTSIFSGLATSGDGSVSVNPPPFFSAGLPGQGGAPGVVPTDGQAGTPNTGGPGGGGGGGASSDSWGGGGAAGCPGEFSKLFLTVTPGDHLTLNVGSGGAGGLGNIGVYCNGGNGGQGGSGIILIFY
jgi:hypothetical protein